MIALLVFTVIFARTFLVLVQMSLTQESGVFGALDVHFAMDFAQQMQPRTVLKV